MAGSFCRGGSQSTSAPNLRSNPRVVNRPLQPPERPSGAYVKTIDLQKDLVDFLASGDRLIAATADGVKFLALD